MWFTKTKKQGTENELVGLTLATSHTYYTIHPGNGLVRVGGGVVTCSVCVCVYPAFTIRCQASQRFRYEVCRNNFVFSTSFHQKN